MYLDMVQLIIENQFMVRDTENEEMNKGEYIILAVNEDREVLKNEQLLKSFSEVKHRLDVNKKMILK